MTGVEVTEVHTQDGWDWPNGVQDERWPAGDGHCPRLTEQREAAARRVAEFVKRNTPAGLPASYWRAMKALGEEL